ncbi:MAG: GatB/YqeY domain-containing protein [Ilumatobacteraceae bacterium]
MSAHDQSTESVKGRLRQALNVAMKARDEVALSALRQALAALAVEETAGAEQVVLSDEQVLKVVAVEVRKHHETADAFVTAGRPEKVERARAEAAVLEAFLPAALDDAALQALVDSTIATVAGGEGMKAMGKVIAAVRAAAGPTADGAKIAALVKASLAG